MVQVKGQMSQSGSERRQSGGHAQCQRWEFIEWSTTVQCCLLDFSNHNQGPRLISWIHSDTRSKSVCRKLHKNVNLNQCVSDRKGNRMLPSWSRHTRIPDQDVVRWKPVGTSTCNWITSQTPQRLVPTVAWNTWINRWRLMRKVHDLLNLQILKTR